MWAHFCASGARRVSAIAGRHLGSVVGLDLVVGWGFTNGHAPDDPVIQMTCFLVGQTRSTSGVVWAGLGKANVKGRQK